MPFKNQHPLYHVWRSMRDRCRNPNNRQWNDYGGRGITICDRWENFHAFVEDMGERPAGYSLDRIDNDGGYSPKNCRWASRKTQQRNRRVGAYVTVDGVRYRAIELAERAGVKTDTIISRAKRGLPLSEVVSPEPIRDTSGLALGGLANGARQQARTHCKNGHELIGDNVRITPEGWRRCLKCHADREAARRALKRAARA